MELRGQSTDSKYDTNGFYLYNYFQQWLNTMERLAFIYIFRWCQISRKYQYLLLCTCKILCCEKTTFLLCSFISQNVHWENYLSCDHKIRIRIQLINSFEVRKYFFHYTEWYKLSDFPLMAHLQDWRSLVFHDVHFCTMLCL